MTSRVKSFYRVLDLTHQNTDNNQDEANLSYVRISRVGKILSPQMSKICSNSIQPQTSKNY